MSEPIVTAPRSRWRKALLVGLAALALPVIITAAIVLAVAGGGPVASPADVIGPPVRAGSAQGDRVYVLTSQWKTFRSAFRSSSTSYTDLYVDVWAFDAADARPVWRHRLARDRSGVNMGRALLGAQGGTLWALDPKGLVGLSLTDGAVVADAARIEAANPGLKGLIPTEASYFRFDAAGLAFTAADGRNWRLPNEGLKAEPATTAPAQAPVAGVVRPAHIAGGNGTYAFMERGLSIGPRWLGLLDAEEAKTFAANGAIGGVDPASHPRMRLWRASIGSKPTFFGPKPTFGAFAPLPESPEFINSGLLSNGVTNSLPILLFRPDSVLVLHRDRLGDAGRLRLTRISGPAGKALWTVELPMQALESVMPGEGSLVLLGARDEPGPRRGPNSRDTVSVDQLVAVDLASGRMGAYGFKVLATNPEKIPASSTNLAAAD